jgi:hypothetical protein
MFPPRRGAGRVQERGCASLAEDEDVSMNIAMIMYGVDPQTKKFTEPPEQINEEIAALKATNPSRNRKRERAWHSSKRRSKAQGPFNSRKTSRWCYEPKIGHSLVNGRWQGDARYLGSPRHKRHNARKTQLI